MKVCVSQSALWARWLSDSIVLKRRLFAATALGLLVAGSVDADEALAKSKNCMACHALDAARIGPSYKAIANRYAGRKDIEATLAERVIKGAKGTWTSELPAGALMPPNATVKPEEAARLVRWILDLR